MEEKTEVRAGSEHPCVCRGAWTNCGMNGHHRFCFRSCCMLRVLGLTAVIVIVFALGFAAGHHGGRGERGWQHDRFRGGMMMNGGDRFYRAAPNMMQPVYQYQIRTLPAQDAASGTPVAPAPGAPAR